MDIECKSITRVLLPAVRASVAEVMHSRYNYTQEEIAAKLGVVQVAVSKYLNGRYSKAIGDAKRRIIRARLNEGVVRSILGKGTREDIDGEIDALCDKLLKFNLA
jgi:predicted transcriptional regulator